MAPKVCEKLGHQRVGWAVTGSLVLGLSLGLVMAGDVPTSIIPGMLAAFCLAAYTGVIKFDAPTKKPKATKESSPAQPSEGEATGTPKRTP